MSEEPEEQPQETTTAVDDSPAPDQGDSVQASPLQFGQLDAGDEVNETEAKGNLELLLDVPVSISVVVGRTRLPLKEVVELGPGAVIELEKKSEEPIDLCVNGKLVAQGEVVVVDDTYGIRITQIVDNAERLGSLSGAE